MIYVIAYLLIGMAVVLRVMPHAPNFAPIAALALFGGVYLNRRFALLIPLAALFVSDFFIGFYSYKIMLSVYLSFGLIGLGGMWLRKHKRIGPVVGATLAGSTLFFLVTNFAVWAFGSLYPPTLGGLLASYTMALPFFKNTLFGDLFYTGVLFGSYELARFLATRRVGSELPATDS